MLVVMVLFNAGGGMGTALYRLLLHMEDCIDAMTARAIPAQSTP